MHNRKFQISTSASLTNAINTSPTEGPRPDPGVVATAKRHSFSTAEKLRSDLPLPFHTWRDADALRFPWKSRNDAAARVGYSSAGK